MINFKLWIFNFDLSSFIAFFIGIFFGIAVLGLIYAISVLLSIKTSNKSSKVNYAVTDEEIKDIIQNAKDSFNDKSLKGANNSIAHCKDICVNLVKDISRKFYPKSKRPFAELTVDEIFKLSIYISNRINELVDRPGLRLIKRVKLSTILGLGDVKKVISESALLKLTKKYKLKKIFSTVMGAINVINPFYWARRIMINTTLDFAIKKLCLAVIGIVGEETYKVYSKRVFNEDKLIDTGVDKLVDDLDNDLKDVSDEEIDDYIANQNVKDKEVKID